MAGSRSVAYMGGVDYPGVQSLDKHGYWAHAGSYGHVWVPDASEGWAPYRFGRWRYLSTGLTWVSHEPWGWLPYHYGRWIYYGPMSRWAWIPGGFNRWQPSLVDFYWGGGYLGWAPRGYYTGGTGGRDGMTVVHRNDLGREPTRTRVLPSDGIVGGLRQGLPRDLRRSRVWNRNSANSNSGVRGSRLASRSPTNSRDGIVQGGTRRPTVSRSGAEGARNLQSFRSTSRNRSISRTSPGSRGSVASRSGRNASRPSVWSSRRSRPANSPTFTSPSGRSYFAVHFRVAVLPVGSHLSKNGLHRSAVRPALGYNPLPGNPVLPEARPALVPPPGAGTDSGLAGNARRCATPYDTG